MKVELVKMKIKTIGCREYYIEPCPYNTNHYDSINDIEDINRVGSINCLQCKYFMGMHKTGKYVICKEI